MTLTYSSCIYHLKCILLTVHWFPEARLGGEPGCEGPFIAACSFNYYYYYYYYSSPEWIAFLRALNMLEKSRNFAHAPEVAKIYIWYGFQKWVWQNGSTAPPIHFQRCAPRATFHVHVWKSVHSCYTPIPTKSLLKQNPKPNRKLAIFN